MGLQVTTSTLAVGATGILLDSVDPMKFLEGIAKSKIRYLVTYPVLIQMMTSKDVLEKKWDFSAVKAIIVAGAPLPPAAMREFHELYPHVEMLGFGYAQTECGIISVNQTGTDFESCGTVIDPIVDVETRELVPDGEGGELLVKTRGIVPGYFDHLEDFVVEKDGFVRTGDFGRKDERGRLFIADRVKDTFVYQGRRVLPSTIENALKELDIVDDVAVVGLDSPIAGEKLPGVFVCLKGDADQEELKRYVKDIDIPQDIEFLERIPRLISGKIRRVDLKNHVPAPRKGFVLT